MSSLDETQAQLKLTSTNKKTLNSESEKGGIEIQLWLWSSNMPAYTNESDFVEFLRREIKQVSDGNTEIFSFISVKDLHASTEATITFNEIKQIQEVDMDKLPENALERIRRTGIAALTASISFQGSGNSIRAVHLIVHIDFNRKIFRELGRVWSDDSDFT